MFRPKKKAEPLPTQEEEEEFEEEIEDEEYSEEEEEEEIKPKAKVKPISKQNEESPKIELTREEIISAIDFNLQRAYNLLQLLK